LINGTSFVLDADRVSWVTKTAVGLDYKNYA
jgi:hypothetical protein